MITHDYFASATGWPPSEDDLERCNCDQAGEPGHWMCGWCEDCNLPRFQCPCALTAPHWRIE